MSAAAAASVEHAPPVDATLEQIEAARRADGRNATKIRCRKCATLIISPRVAKYAQLDDGVVIGSSAAENAPLHHFWQLGDLMHFDNISLSHPVDDVRKRFLMCGECQAEVLGFVELDGEQRVLLSAERVAYDAPPAGGADAGDVEEDEAADDDAPAVRILPRGGLDALLLGQGGHDTGDGDGDGDDDGADAGAAMPGMFNMAQLLSMLGAQAFGGDARGGAGADDADADDGGDGDDGFGQIPPSLAALMSALMSQVAGAGDDDGDDGGDGDDHGGSRVVYLDPSGEAAGGAARPSRVVELVDDDDDGGQGSAGASGDASGGASGSGSDAKPQ